MMCLCYIWDYINRCFNKYSNNNNKKKDELLSKDTEGQNDFVDSSSDEDFEFV